ncbi:MAG: SMC-Scp complex subunit ScpB [Chloroherpetonaceae bacterium]|nr:SMC-Scp complex subunit ScpB [Chthonomonadaceae bacterium]MDW8206494.1 SMC-Scp complex subunit ScpB [Chloroherpetonaceae bacterium]
MSDPAPLLPDELVAALECLLFVSGEPVPLTELSRATGRDSETIACALHVLRSRLEERGSGLQLLHIAGGWQLSTRPEHAEAIGRLLTRDSHKLSRAALETLAIIAYRQPITAPEIEAVRGVSVSGVLRTLLDRRLIQEAGRKETVGRPVLYRTTPDFLHYFGLSDLSQLPPLGDETPAEPVPAEAVTDGRVPDGEACTGLQEDTTGQIG